MKNTLSKIVTLLLVAVMLFTASAPMVASAADSVDTGSESSAGSTSQGSGDTGENETLGSLETGWCDVKYTAEGIEVTLTPDLDALKLVDKEMLKELVSILIEAVKKVVLDDLMADIVGDTATLADTDGLTPDNMWTSALAGYVSDKYGASDLDAYVSFLTDALDSDEKVEELAVYACDLVKAAVIVGKVSRDDLPLAEDIEVKVADMMEDLINEFITDEVDRIVSEYVDHIHANPDSSFGDMTGMDQFVEDYIGDYIEREIERHVEHIMDPDGSSAEDDFMWDYIDGYLSDKVKAIVNEYIDYLIDPTKGFEDDPLHGYVRSYFDALIAEAEQHYIDPPAEPSALDTLLKGYIDEFVQDYIEERVKEYVEVKQGNGTLEGATDIDTLINEKIDSFITTYVTDAVDAYISLKTGAEGGADGSVVNEAIVERIDEYVSDYIDGQFEEYRQVKLGSTDAVPTLYDLIEEKVRAWVVEQIMDQMSVDRATAELYYDEGFNYADYDTQISLAYTDIKAEILADVTQEDYEKAFELLDVAAVIDEVIAGASDEDIEQIVSTIDVDSVIADVKATVTDGELQAILDTVAPADIMKFIGTEKAHTIVDELNFSEVLSETLGSFDEAEKEEFLATVHSTFTDTAERHALLVEVIEQIGDAELDEILATIRDEVIAEAHSAAFDDVIKEVLGIDVTMAEIDARVPEIAAIIAAEYTEMLASLDELGDGALQYAELLKLITDISVDGEVIYDAAGLRVDALKSIVADLPTFGEIAEMDKEDMQLSYSFLVNTNYGGCDFTLTAKLGGGYETVKKIARILADHVDIYVKKGTLVLDVRVPEKLSRAILKVCATDKISDALKQKIFTALSADIDDVYALYKDLTFDDVIQLLEAIDFEGILDSEFIKQYVDLTGLSNKEIVEKVKEYEGYFNKAMSLVGKLFDKIPDRFRDNTLMDLYYGDGCFGYEGTHTVNIESALTAISSQYGPLIASYIDRESITASVDFDVSFEKINRIEYVVVNSDGTKTTVRKGFLPAGADVAFFSGKTTHENKKIVAWVNKEGKAVTEMPDADTVLVAVTDKEYGIVTGSGVEMTYDPDSDFTVLVTVTGAENATVTYKWYKDGQVIEETDSSFTVKNVADSGTYKCVATVTEGALQKTLTSDEIVVKINKAVIDRTAVSFDYVDDQPFVYDGNEHQIGVLGLPAGVTAVLKDGVGTSVGNYTAVIESLTVDPELFDTANYELDPEIVGMSVDWEIVKCKINVGELEWNYTGALAYTGNEQTVALKSVPAGVVPVYKNNAATEVGSYTASVSFELAEGYSSDSYEIVGSVENLSWTIAGKVIVIPDTVKWSYTEPLKYNGQVQTVTLTGLPEGVTPSYEGNSASAIGDYTATVTFVANDPDFAVVGSVAPLSWSIVKGELDLSSVAWNYTAPITYTGSEIEVLLANLPDAVVAEYSGNKATDVGSYTASVVLALKPEEVGNYELKNAVVADLPWSIAKVVVDLADISWSYSVAFTYDGSTHQVVVSGLPEQYDPEQLVVTYTGNSAKNAGTYTAKVSIVSTSDNYEVVGSGVMALEWVIDKADYDMSGVTFPDTTLEYNGLPQGITVVGTLPEGVTVKYTESKIFAGVYSFTATFLGDESNYNPIAPMTATLTITVHKENLHVYKNTAGDIVVEVGSVAGVPGDHSFVVSDDSHIYDGFELENGAWGKVLVAYDIYFAQGGVYQNVSDDFTVKLLIPRALREKTNLQVVYVKDNGDLENIESTREGDYMVFDTTHFSTYAIIEITEPPTDQQPVDLTWLWIVLAIVAVGAVVVVIIILVKRKKKGDDGEPTEETEPTVEPEDDTDAIAEPTEETPTEEVPTEEVPAEETPAEEVPAEETPAEETPAEETPAEETPAEETPAEEVPAEEVPAEETPAEETPAEETPVEEAPKVVSEPLVFLESSGEDEDGVSRAMVGGEVVLVRFRSSFRSRLIQSDEEIQNYYTVIKNTLMSYKGVKARTSWNYESFNRGRVQCAKVNIKGRTLVVCLGLEPSEYNAAKYHFTDVSDKPKFDKVPMMMKIRSERALKYTLELIEEMMSKLDIEQGAIPTEDYRMPYESTEQLARRGLVKVILPAGMTLDDSSNVVKVNVGEFISSAGGTEVAGEPVAEPVAEPTVTESAVEPISDTADSEPIAVEVIEDGEDSVGRAVVDGETILIRYRRSFQSRLIQSSDTVQSYYTAIKNALLSYKGVKSRTSWKHESFNRGRVQCAKVNVKGKTLMVYLALDPNDYNVNKYHFTDVSGKGKFEKVPMLMKVRSDRGLKYTLELIAEMMAKLEIAATTVPTEDYSMPYETTEELVKRGLIKVVLPAGMTLDENANIVKANVSDLIGAGAPVEEAPVEEAPVEEAPVEEAPVEEAPVEEAPVEEVIHVDAVHADELVTDEEAETMIEVIHTAGTKRTGKLVTVNLDTICESFEDGEVVTLEALKERRLIPKNAGRVKVLARGIMTKTLTVIASKFSLQAVKMITLAGGHADVED